MTLTKEEQIQAIYDLKVGYKLGYADITMLKSMARQFLAALESRADAEPYGYVHKAAYEQCGTSGLSNDHEGLSESPDHIPLYTRPQPAPVVPEIIVSAAERLIKEYVLNKGSGSEFIACITPGRSTIGKGGVWDEWRKLDAALTDYRAARLRGKAEPVSQPYTLPDGYALVPVEPTPEMLTASYMFAHVDNTVDSWKAMLAAAPRPDVK